MYIAARPDIAEGFLYVNSCDRHTFHMRIAKGCILTSVVSRDEMALFHPKEDEP